MKPGDVLEHNLERLFAKSYAPVRAEPAFRARLVRALEVELDTRSTRARARVVGQEARRPHGATARAPRSRAWIALAAALLALVGGLAAYQASRGSRASTSEDLVARGSVAVREDGEAWRAASDVEVANGIDTGAPAFAIATPAGVDVTVRLGSAGRVRIGAESAAAWTSDASAGERRIELERGSLTLERYGSSGAWTVATRHGDLDLAHGELDVRYGDGERLGAPGECAIVRLRRGVATRLPADGAASLALGVDVYLRGGSVLAASVSALDASPFGARTSIEPPPPASTSGASTAPAAPLVRVALRVPEGAALPPRFAVTALRRERLPQISQPVRRELDALPRFALDGLEPGTYDFYLEAEGFAVALAKGNVLADSDVDVELALERPLALRGRIVDATSGAPIEGADVIAEDLVPAQVVPFTLDDSTQWLAHARSGADGRFVIEHAGPGPHVLRATHAGHAAAWTGRVEAGAHDEIELALHPPSRIHGIVRTRTTAPWPGAFVIASRLDQGETGERMSFGIAISDDDGRYAIDDLPAGAYVLLNVLDVRGTQGGGVPVVETRVARGASVQVDLGASLEGARVRGTLRDADGRALDDFDVSIQHAGAKDGGGWRAERTDGGGHYEFVGVPAGTYEVYVGRGLGRCQVRNGTVEVPSALDVVHDLVLPRGTLRGTAPQSGRGAAILSDADGEFVGRFVLDASKRLEFPGLRNGVYSLVVYAGSRGLAPAVRDGIEISDATHDVEITVEHERGASVRVRVRDAEGRPVAGAFVGFRDESGRVQRLTLEETTDPGGELDVPGLARGRWTIEASRDGRRASRALVLEAGDDERVELVLSAKD